MKLHLIIILSLYFSLNISLESFALPAPRAQKKAPIFLDDDATVETTTKSLGVIPVGRDSEINTGTTSTKRTPTTPRKKLQNDTPTSTSTSTTTTTTTTTLPPTLNPTPQAPHDFTVSPNSLCNTNCQLERKNYPSLLSLWIAVATLGILLLAIVMPMVFYLFVTRKQYFSNETFSDDKQDLNLPQSFPIARDTVDMQRIHQTSAKKAAISPDSSQAAMSDAFGFSINSQPSASPLDVAPDTSTNNANAINATLPKLTYTSSSISKKKKKSKGKK